MGYIIVDWSSRDRTLMGLGDRVRGLLATLAYANDNGLELFVDTTGSCWETFFEYRTPAEVRHRASDERSKIIALFSFKKSKLNLNDVLKGRANFMLITNYYPQRFPTEGEKEFVRSLLIIRPQWHWEIPSIPYGLIHVRIGDHILVLGKSLTSVPSNVSDIIKYTSTRTDLPWYMISDSAQLDEMVKIDFPDKGLSFRSDLAERGISTATAKPGHMGRTSDVERLALTIRDIQLICGAKEIVTTSSYIWTSGFPLWLAVINNIKIGTRRAPIATAERRLFGDSLVIKAEAGHLSESQHPPL